MCVCVQVAPHIKACNTKFEEALALAKKQHEAAEAAKAAKTKDAVKKEGKVRGQGCGSARVCMCVHV